jgi:hypothetical protein
LVIAACVVAVLRVAKVPYLQEKGEADNLARKRNKRLPGQSTQAAWRTCKTAAKSGSARRKIQVAGVVAEKAGASVAFQPMS